MIRTTTLALFVGVLILQYLPQRPPGAALALFPLAIILLFAFKSYYMRIMLFIVLGFGWANFQTAWLLQNKLAEEWIGQDIQVEGHIASLPERAGRKTRFEFDVVAVLNTHNLSFPDKLVLSVYKPGNMRLNVGDKWRFTVRVKPPRDFANPGSFAYSKWLLQKGILATGYVRARYDNVLLQSHVGSYPVQRFRQHLQSRLTSLKTEPRFLPFVRALVIGDRAGLTAEDWSVLQRTGTVHLMAISGLHVGLVAAFMFFVVRILWSWIPGAPLYLAAPRVAAIMAWLFAFAYSALAGFALPTQRAMIMLSVVLLAVVIQKSVKPSYVLSITLLVILLLDSFAVLSISFWLSFGAVALIYYFIYTTGRTGSRSRRVKFGIWLNLQIVISLGLLPLTIQFFQQAPILSPLTNAVAVPVIGFVVVPLCFLGCVLLFIHEGLAIIVFNFISLIFAWLWDFLQCFSELSFSTYAFATPTLPALILALLGLMIILLPRVFRVRVLGFFLFLPIILPLHEEIEPGEFKLSVLDVGQGLATVIQTSEHNLVFDTGPRYSRYFDTGRAVVIPFLREKGIKRLDMLMISHADNDHIGGARSVLAAIDTAAILTSVPEKRSHFAPLDARRCQRGQAWEWDGVSFEVIHPDSDDYNKGLSENNLSCVLLVTSQKRSALLTGDIEREAETLILHRYAALRDIDLMVVPHHGSKTSSSAEFTRRLSPRIAVIPVGWRNRYHFPHQGVVKRYHDQATRIVLSSESGAIAYHSSSNELSLFREQHRFYWD